MPPSLPHQLTSIAVGRARHSPPCPSPSLAPPTCWWRHPFQWLRQTSRAPHPPTLCLASSTTGSAMQWYQGKINYEGVACIDQSRTAAILVRMPSRHDDQWKIAEGFNWYPDNHFLLNHSMHASRGKSNLSQLNPSTHAHNIKRKYIGYWLYTTIKHEYFCFGKVMWRSIVNCECKEYYNIIIGRNSTMSI